MDKIVIGINVIDEGGSAMYTLKEIILNDRNEIVEITTDSDFSLSFEECDDLYGFDYQEEIKSAVEDEGIALNFIYKDFKMDSVTFKTLKDKKYVFVGKNKIYFDDYGDDYYFVVEKYEFTDNETDMFSVIDGYTLWEDAVQAAKFNQ